jgi:hypothetical protein
MSQTPDSDHAVDAPLKETSPATLRTVAWWSIKLFSLTVIGGAFILLAGPFVLAPFFPNGRFAVYLFRCLPLVHIVVWLAGIVAAYRKHKSFKIAGSLVVVGSILFVTLPIWMYLIVLASVGGWNVGK